MANPCVVGNLQHDGLLVWQLPAVIEIERYTASRRKVLAVPACPAPRRHEHDQRITCVQCTVRRTAQAGGVCVLVLDAHIEAVIELSLQPELHQRHLQSSRCVSRDQLKSVTALESVPDEKSTLAFGQTALLPKAVERGGSYPGGGGVWSPVADAKAGAAAKAAAAAVVSVGS